MNVICKVFGHDFASDSYWLRDRSYNRRHDEQCILLVHRCKRCGEIEFRPVNLDVRAWVPSIYDEDVTHRPDDDGGAAPREGIPTTSITRNPR